ncbi:MAG TPA: hypothetical protein VIJ93_14525, partial [bacterium]
MTPYLKRYFYFPLSPALFVLLYFLPLSPVFAVGDNFFFVAPPTSAYAGVTYSTVVGTGGGNSVTFNVQAKNAGIVDNSFNDTVTVGFYDTVTGQISESQAVFVPGPPNAGAPITGGTAALTFKNGLLNFGVTLTSGSNSMQVSISDATVTSGDTYPGTIGGPLNPGYFVQGFFAPYYLEASSGTTIPAFYTAPNGPTDKLLTAPTGFMTGNDYPVTVINSNSVSNSLCFAVTGITGGYTGLGAGVTGNLYFSKQYSSVAPVTYEVILDYGNAPSGPLTDYNNPDLAYDTVYKGSAPNVNLSSGNPSKITNFSSITRVASLPSFMSNGQIIVRAWTSAPVTNTVYLDWASSSGFLSFVNIPYSTSNVQPVTAAISPLTILDSSVATVNYSINNQYSSPISYLSFQIPPNNPPSGTPFAITVPPTLTGHGGTLSVVSQATASQPGTITWDSAGGTPIAVDQIATIAMNVTCSSQSNSWVFPLLLAQTSTGGNAPLLAPTSPILNSVTVPNVPSPFTSSVNTYINSGGNNVDLNWGQVTNEACLGYRLTRAGGAAFTPVTITPNSLILFTDSGALNLQAYTYSLVAFNAVTQSAVTTVSATPYVNPGPPGSLTTASSGTSVLLNWTAPVSVAGSYPVTGYQIFRGTSPGGEGGVPLTQVGLGTSFNDTGLISGTTYYYKMAAIDNQYVSGSPLAPHISGNSPEVQGFPPGYPPTGVTPNHLPGSSPATIQLSWTAPVGNLNTPFNYLIYRGANGPAAPYTIVGSSPVTFNDTAVTIGSYYVYQVAGLDSAGVTTNFSTPVTGRVGPAAPTGLSASPSNGSVTLTWNTNNPAESVTMYVVYQGGVQAGTAFAPGGTVTLIDGTQNADVTLSYQVEGVDSSGVTGTLSSPAVLTARLPTVPTGLAVVADPNPRNQADVSWTASPQTIVTGYKLYRGTTSAFPPANPTTFTLPLQITYQDTGLSAGTTYFYFLQAQNIGGAGPQTAPKGLQIPPNPPGAPTASSGSAAITVQWPGNNAAEKVSLYTVYRSLLSASGYASVGTANSPGVSFIDTPANGLATGKDYYYKITATNPGFGPTILGGESLQSVSIKTGLLPQPPGNLAAVMDAGVSTSIDVSWTAVTGVDSNATSLTLYVNSSPPNSAVTNTAALYNITPASTAATVIAGTNPDTSYYYWLQTNSAYGSGALAGPITQLTYPATVALSPVTLALDGVSRLLTWTPDPADVTQYNVYRQQNGGSFFPVQSFPAAGLTFPVTLTLPVQAGQIYGYRVTAVNATGEGLPSNVQLIGIAPSVPSVLTAVSGISSSVTQVNLTWSANALAENVTGYTVYRSSVVTGPYGTPVTSKLATANDSDSSGVTGLGVYYYLAAADDANGVESLLNTVNAVAVTAFALPNTPGGVTAIAGTGQDSVSWIGATQTTYPVSIYNVYRISGGVTVKVNGSPAAAPVTDVGVTNGKAYTYFVQTVDTQGHLSVPSALSPFVQPAAPPSLPGNVTATGGDKAVQITWSAASAGTLPIGFYLIAEIAPGPVTTYFQAPAGATGYVDTNLTNGTSYSYFLQAVDSSGVTLAPHISPQTALLTKVPNVVNVNPPSNLYAHGNPGSATVTWTDSFQGAGSPVTGYQLWRSTASVGPYAIAANPVTGVQTFTDPGLANGTSYYYYFVAFANGTPSSNSATVFATPARPPNLPTSITEIDGSNAATLNWTPNVPLDVAISSYVIYRAALPGAPSQAGTVFSPIVTFPDSLTNATTYTYQIQVVNLNGTTSALSAPVTAYPYSLVAPAGVTTSASATGVTLVWSIPGGPSYPVTGYSVFRSTTSGVYGAPLTVLAAAGSPMTFTDSSASLGQLYYYEIKAIDNKGHLGTASVEVLDGAANPPPTPASFMAFAGDSQVLLDWGPSSPVTG